jgi:thiamine-monophosphate kinase
MSSAEDDLIERLFAPIAGRDALGLRDDAALLRPQPGRELVLTKDALVAGVHFFPDDPPASIARKALGVNLSDLAAKRARPVGFLLALALPRPWDDAWLGAFATALGAAATEAGCPLLGGDTVSTPGPLMVSITALGDVAPGAMLPRTGARAADRLYVSGTIGDAALGLLLRLAERGETPMPPWAAGLPAAERAHLRDRYLHPQPRLALHDALLHAHAGMDVSDGLVGDGAKMLRVSGVAGRLDLRRVPLSPAAAAAVRASAAAWETIVTGGDDYEILAAVGPDAAPAFEAAALAAGIPVTVIGTLRAGTSPLDVVDATGAPVTYARPSFSHG